MPYRLHDLRHTYACRLAEKGVNPAAAQRVLGHTDITITMRYYRLVESDVFAQVAGVSDFVLEPSESPSLCHVCATPHEHNE